MANRDALWVNDKGQTVPVIVDEQGNLVEPAPAAKPAEAELAAPFAAQTPTEEGPFAGKGDHDLNGKVGGAHASVRSKRGPKARRG